MTYGAHDLETLNVVLAQFPDICDLIDGIRALDDLTYPVDSLASLSGHGVDNPASTALLAVLRQAPAFYFPLASKADLVAKLLELRRSSPLVQAPVPNIPPWATWPGAAVAGPAAASAVFVTEGGPLARPRVEQASPAPAPTEE